MTPGSRGQRESECECVFRTGSRLQRGLAARNYFQRVVESRPVGEVEAARRLRWNCPARFRHWCDIDQEHHFLPAVRTFSPALPQPLGAKNMGLRMQGACRARAPGLKREIKSSEELEC